MKGIYFKGDVYLRRFDAAGVLSNNVIGPIEGTKLTIKADTDIKERKGKGRDTHGQVLATASTHKPTKVGLSMDGVDTALLAIVFLGSATDLSVDNGTVTAESKALPHDTWVKLAHRNVSSVVIAGKTLGTDYEVNGRLGMVKALSTGSIANNASTSMAYAFGDITGTHIAGGSVSKVDVELLFDGVSLEDGSEIYIRVPKLTVMPKSDIDVLSNDFVNAELDGTAIKLDGQDEFEYDDNVVYA